MNIVQEMLGEALQPACVAALGSSGLVPLSLPNCVLNEYGIFANTPESDESPSFLPRRVPYQTALASRITKNSPV